MQTSHPQEETELFPLCGKNVSMSEMNMVMQGPHSIVTLHREIAQCPPVYNKKECNTSVFSARGEPERVQCKLLNA